MVEGEGGVEEDSSYDGQTRRNLRCRWTEVVVEGEGGLEEDSSYDGQPRRNLNPKWREVVVVEEEKKALKSEAGDRFLTSDPGFRGMPKACDMFPARAHNTSRLEFGGNAEGM